MVSTIMAELEDGEEGEEDADDEEEADGEGDGDEAGPGEARIGGISGPEDVFGVLQVRRRCRLSIISKWN